MEVLGRRRHFTGFGGTDKGLSLSRDHRGEVVIGGGLGDSAGVGRLKTGSVIWLAVSV